MSWTLVQDGKLWIWKCTKYSDLNYAEINNLAEYGEPMSPYEPGFIHDFVPDFGQLIVEMPQLEVMTHGYGRSIHASSFALVQRFLDGRLVIPPGSHTLGELIDARFVREPDRRIKSNLYGLGNYGVSAGEINAGDAAYIHGTVGFALRPTSIFTTAPTVRQVRAEIGALDDNWDFDSSEIPQWINNLVATLFGPDHNNLTAPIELRYRGPGKISTEERRIPPSSRNRIPGPAGR